MAEQLNLRDEPETSMTEGDLPAQIGPQTPTILPGTDLFQLPANIDQCWEAKDYEKKDDDGNVLMDPNDPTKAQVEQHYLLKFDQNNPMLVVGGEWNGLPATATITTIPRRRGRKGDEKAPLVHDIAYFVRESLAHKSGKVHNRRDWIPMVNAHPGAIVRLDHGLSAQCATDRVRWIDDGTGTAVPDPDGNQGCGDAAGRYVKSGGKTDGQPETRLYTNAFKVPVFLVDLTNEAFKTREEALEVAVALGGGAANVKQGQGWTDHVVCKGCGALLRGFFRIEKFLEPLGATQPAG
ncbi:MAG TPA: hypothetical protein VFO16_01560 [Pseudonocardiaceae bacterium]|nr:hypothetical protein [Pseudonocardiaceae bacterium]